LRDTATLTLPDHHRLARAFLSLTDDGAPEPAPPSRLSKPVAAFAAALVLALAAPLTWMAPEPVTTGKVGGDQPAATLGSSKAALAAADDEDPDGGE
jgi:hypothetical protein